MAFYEHQDSAAPADCLLFFDRPCLLAYDALFERIGVCPVDLFLFDLPVWLAVGTIGSASALPDMPQAGYEPGACGSRIQDFPGLVRNGTDLYGGAYSPSRAWNADQLVQYPALALPRYVVGIPVCRFRRGISLS